MGKGTNYFKDEEIEGEIINCFEAAFEEAKKSVKKEEEKKIINKNKKWQAVINLSPEIIKIRTYSGVLERKDSQKKIEEKEKDLIYKEAFAMTKKKIAEKFYEDNDVLYQDIHFESFEIIEKKINGYEINDFKGYKGREIEFSAFTTFFKKDYLEILKKLNIEIIKIDTGIRAMNNFLMKEKSGMILDIGGKDTRVLIFKNGKIKNSKEFKGGSNIFSLKVMDVFGINRNLARTLKEEYIEGKLSPEVSLKIRKIFLKESKIWHNDLWRTLKGSKEVPGIVFLIGGGSLIPEIRETLKEFSIKPIKIEKIKLENQYMPLLLSCLSLIY